MALQASGSISASQIRNEFAGVTQVSFSDYFRHAEPTDGLEDFSETYTSANNSGIPTSGAIKFSDFYSKYREVMFKVGSVNVRENANTSTLFSTYWGTNVPKRLKNNGTIGATSTANVALTVSSNISNTLVIDNAGSIQGAGGAAGAANGGNGGDGGTAILLNSFCSINNTGTIYGGGGGGGAGTAGGTGGNGGSGTYTVTTYRTCYWGGRQTFFPNNFNACFPDGGAQSCASNAPGDIVSIAGCQGGYSPGSGCACGSCLGTCSGTASVATTGGTGGPGGNGGNGGNGEGYDGTDSEGSFGGAGTAGTAGGTNAGNGGNGGNGGGGGEGGTFGANGSPGNQGNTGNGGSSGNVTGGTGGTVGGTPVGTGGAAGYYLYLSRNVSWIAQGTTAGNIFF